MTLPGLWAIDRFGRRPVLLIGALGMGGVSHAPSSLLSAYMSLSSVSEHIMPQKPPTNICKASTFGPCAWVVTGEIFSLQTRAKGLSMTTAANWFFNWLLSFITPYLTGALAPTQSNVFWI
ncbi:Sugar and other transporter [Aspergillus sclerotialis]|uniref:Sugar and other transporter n=1 Tax=Aspergillus sclerotialis TaxID=2070753 RepID=A0A3A2ZI41_9EURO|nr:Sugar and other transporter [Aspergillus sclerotialis]